MRTLARIVVAACALISPLAHAQSTLAVEAFGRLPAVSSAAISPDGSKIALAINGEAGASVIVLDLDTQARIFGARVQDNQELRSVGWADDGRVTFVVSRAFAPGQILPDNWFYRGAPRRVEFYRAGTMNLANHQMRLLSTSDEAWADQGSQLIAPIEGDIGFGRLIGEASPAVNTGRAIFRVDLDNGQVREVIPQGNNRDTRDYLLDQHGAVVVRTDSNDATNRWSIFVYDHATPRLLLSGVSDTGEPRVDPQGLLGDGRLVTLGDDAAGNFSALYAVDLATGAREEISHLSNQDVDSAIIDPWTRLVVGVSWIEQESRQHFFDAALQSAYERLSDVVGGATRIISWSRDRSRILVYGERGLDGGAYYVFTPASGRVVRVSYCYPELAAAQSGQREALTYPARDGVRIPAYLTLPSGDAHHLPLILLVHGGPGSRDTMNFDWWAAFLAARGYAVLQPNFRGSNGYGSAWEQAGLGEWGGLMQTDVEDGIGPLARAGIIDPTRVCIIGASYGGYAALAGATLTPNRYRCAVSVAGISDLIEFVRQRELQAGSASMQADYWRRSIGDRRDHGAHIRAISPANLADRVQIPILLVHGTNDSVVPIDQSRLMRDRLQAAAKGVRYVELPGDDHWLSHAPTRVQLLREVDSFLATNLPIHPTQ